MRFPSPCFSTRRSGTDYDIMRPAMPHDAAFPTADSGSRPEKKSFPYRVDLYTVAKSTFFGQEDRKTMHIRDLPMHSCLMRTFVIQLFLGPQPWRCANKSSLRIQTFGLYTHQFFVSFSGEVSGEISKFTRR